MKYIPITSGLFSFIIVFFYLRLLFRHLPLFCGNWDVNIFMTTVLLMMALDYAKNTKTENYFGKINNNKNNFFSSIFLYFILMHFIQSRKFTKIKPFEFPNPFYGAVKLKKLSWRVIKRKWLTADELIFIKYVHLMWKTWSFLSETIIMNNSMKKYDIFLHTFAVNSFNVIDLLNFVLSLLIFKSNDHHQLRSKTKTNKFVKKMNSCLSVSLFKLITVFQY